jgi:hypothetical protein
VDMLFSVRFLLGCIWVLVYFVRSKPGCHHNPTGPSVGEWPWCLEIWVDFKYLSLSSCERYIKTWKVVMMSFCPRSHVFERAQVNPKKLRVKGRISRSWVTIRLQWVTHTHTFRCSADVSNTRFGQDMWAYCCFQICHHLQPWKLFRREL